MRCYKCGGSVFPLSDEWPRCQQCGTEPDTPRPLTAEDKTEAEIDRKYAKAIENRLLTKQGTGRWSP